LKAYIERGEVPEVLRSDAWLIRQNALRLLSALEAFLLRFNAPETVLRAKILALRLEYGAPEKLCPLLQLDGVGIKQATQLYAQGIRSPFDITGTMLSRLVAGSRIAQSISKLPEIVIDMQLPDSIAFGQGLMCHATLANARGGARVSVTVFANGLKMLRDSFYLANGYTKSIPIGTYGSQNERVTYQVRVEHLDCVEAPQIREKVIMIDGLPNELSAATSNAGKRLITTDNGTRDQTEVPRFSIPPGALETPLTTPHHGSRRENTKPDEGVLDVRSRSVGRCKQCGGSLNRAGSAITCDCGAVYKLPSGAELTESTCSCGLPKFRLKLLGVDVCIDRRCESMDDVISKHFATSNFTCPRCQGPLTIVRRKGIIVGCVQYYDGCKTAFLLPANATIVGRCECGLPKLQLKTKTRCLDTACRA
jgi:ssDNA-binding Zn-finger/Zn-ribbon topoisomerase 1